MLRYVPKDKTKNQRVKTVVKLQEGGIVSGGEVVTRLYQPIEDEPAYAGLFKFVDTPKPSLADPESIRSKFKVDREALQKLKGHTNEVDAVINKALQLENEINQMSDFDVLNQTSAFRTKVAELQSVINPAIVNRLANSKQRTEESLEINKEHKADSAVLTRNGRVFVEEYFLDENGDVSKDPYGNPIKKERYVPISEYMSNKNRMVPISSSKAEVLRDVSSNHLQNYTIDEGLKSTYGLNFIHDELQNRIKGLGSEKRQRSTKILTDISKKFGDFTGFVESMQAGENYERNDAQVQLLHETWNYLNDNQQAQLKLRAAQTLDLEGTAKNMGLENLSDEELLELGGKYMMGIVFDKARSLSTIEKYAETVPLDQLSGGASTKTSRIGPYEAAQYLETSQIKDYSLAGGVNSSLILARDGDISTTSGKALVPYNESSWRGTTTGQVSTASGGLDVDVENLLFPAAQNNYVTFAMLDPKTGKYTIADTNNSEIKKVDDAVKKEMKKLEDEGKVPKDPIERGKLRQKITSQKEKDLLGTQKLKVVRLAKAFLPVTEEVENEIMDNESLQANNSFSDPKEIEKQPEKIRELMKNANTVWGSDDVEEYIELSVIAPVAAAINTRWMDGFHSTQAAGADRIERTGATRQDQFSMKMDFGTGRYTTEDAARNAPEAITLDNID